MKQFKHIIQTNFNLINQILYVELITIKENEIKQLNFIGLCIHYKKKCGSFVIKNAIKKETVTFVLNIRSPLLLKLTRLNIYRKKNNLARIK
jgi:hypothetical protein